MRTKRSRRRAVDSLFFVVAGSKPSDPPPGGGGANTRALADPSTPARTEARLASLNRLTPVTEQQLLNPPPGDWLHWRRTYNGHGVSPLAQINRNNVKNLKVAWAWSLAPGVNESAPLVHDGIMYVWNYGDRVQALDARTGNLLWQYSRELPSDITLASFLRTKKHLAIAGNKLILADNRRASHCTRCKVWNGSLGHYGRRLQAQVCLQLWSSCHSRQSAHGHHELFAWQPRLSRRRMAALSRHTISRRARSSGASIPSPNPASPAATAGITCPLSGGMARRSGRRAVTTLS